MKETRADTDHYPSRDMRPWHGGDTAPADWGGGPVRYRDGKTESATSQNGRPDDIIAYTPKPLDQSQADGGVIQADRDLRSSLLKCIVAGLDRPCSEGDMVDDRTRELDEIIARHRLAHATPSQSPSPADGVREAVEGLCMIRSNFERIAALHPNEQPAYKNGVRPFGTGDLQHIVETLNAGIAALSTPRDDVRQPADAGPVPATERAGAFNEAIMWLRAISKWLMTHDYDMALPSGILDTDPLDIADRLAALADTQPATAQGGKRCSCARSHDPDQFDHQPGCLATTPPPPAVSDDVRVMREALGLALSYLIESEPGDSRLVSDEFVAMAAIQAGSGDLDEAISIIRRAALARTEEGR